MKKNIAYLVLNTLTLIFTLIMNSLSGTTVFGSKNVGEISHMFPNLFTPAAYAFSIWGLIYLMLIAFVVHQWVAWFRKKEDYHLRKIGLLFVTANLANGFWVIAWLNLYIGFSAVIMVVLLGSLVGITIKLRLELDDVPKRIVVFVWWPITIYLGWIIVATVANITAFLVSQGWYGGNILPETWTIIMICIASVIYLMLVYFRNMREAALVGVWSLVAIAVKHWDQQANIVGVALIASSVIAIAVVIHAFKSFQSKS